jgi:FkbM family methyltransferase
MMGNYLDDLRDFARNKYKGLRRRFFQHFRPIERTLKHIKYRNAEFIVTSNEDVGWRLITKKAYEPHEISCLESILKKDDICIDIGSNIGIYSIFIGLKAFHGTVHSFEPISLNRRIIALNAEINDLKNVVIHHQVVSDHNGSVTFEISEDSGFSSLISTNRKKTISTISTDSITLDNFLGNLGIKGVGVIKIDVEGAELRVLKGATDLLASPDFKPRALLIECCDLNQTSFGYSPKDLLAFMQQYGYQAYSVTENGPVLGWPIRNGGDDVLFLPQQPK